MRIEVHADRTRVGSLIAGILVGISALVVCTVTAGPVAAAAAGALGVGVVIPFLRLYPRHFRRKAAQRDASVYTAEVNRIGVGIGVLRITRDHIELDVGRAQGATAIPKDEIECGDLGAVNRVMRATRATFTTSSGGVYRCTITAPATEVAEALRGR
jgi:hypothetical protein